MSDFHTLMYKCETGAAIDVLCTGYCLCILLCVLDELFHVFKKLKADDLDAQCVVSWGTAYCLVPLYRVAWK